MATRVLNFSRAHPAESQGYTTALARLEKTLAEVEIVAARQQSGINALRSATARKRELRRKIRRTQLFHLARVAEAAAGEVPDMAQKFVLMREAVPYLAFRTAARGMSAEAQNQKELLVKHGLLDSVLQDLSHSLDQFDQAVEQGTDARRTHIGASADLDALAEELIQIMRSWTAPTGTASPATRTPWPSGRARGIRSRRRGRPEDRRTGGQRPPRHRSLRVARSSRRHDAGPV